MNRSIPIVMDAGALSEASVRQAKAATAAHDHDHAAVGPLPQRAGDPVAGIAERGRPAHVDDERRPVRGKGLAKGCG